MKHKVILVTDGDEVARSAIEVAARNVGGRTISLSSGNPTSLSGQEIIELIMQVSFDPVVVMVDDCGETGKGRGEQIISELAENQNIEILGVVAVASNTDNGDRCEVDFSISAEGKVVDKGVDKEGNITEDKYITGDTLYILKDIKVPVIVGIGDPGKMRNKDSPENGAPITTLALSEILKRSKKGNHE